MVKFGSGVGAVVIISFGVNTGVTFGSAMVDVIFGSVEIADVTFASGAVEDVTNESVVV